MAAAFILHAGTVCVLTGAGISTESNLPDFRSSSGWWRKIDPKTVASVEALTNEYELFHSFYSARITALKQAEPNNGHDILAAWEAGELVQLTATQNVDGLHQRAGSQKTAELHGSLASFSCSVCHESAGKDAFLEGVGCRVCGGNLRPDVVLFGEPLPQEAWEKTFEAVRNADVLIVIGTSLEVAPANQIPRQTRGRKIYINKDRAGTWEDFDLILTGSAGSVLKQIDFWIQAVKQK
ncbi:NAD-dependent protein deacylase [Alkalicoccus urumqiensis]|uniref:protein acetyllysine N-acetyltransferase n=2 Tax=Alkalicoccus urumqiensis TaxID=1548213 RepID=A0A2P6MGV7_ALKUR|nr:NAD-dependent protein deacylase [Alkalicoccus urumqiensis]